MRDRERNPFVTGVVRKPRPLRGGDPCGRHPNCLSHVHTPCEGCGRKAGMPSEPARTPGKERDA